MRPRIAVRGRAPSDERAQPAAIVVSNVQYARDSKLPGALHHERAGVRTTLDQSQRLFERR